jgi:crotonobetaine/carnitine-CoA ligase
MVLVPRFSATRFWDVSVRNSCTWASVIPFCVAALRSLEVPAHHSYRLWGNAVCDLPEDVPFRVRTLGWYGMTETVTQVIMGEPYGQNVPLTVGRAVPGYELAILRQDGSAVDPDETGDLFVRGVPGVSLFAGYLHDEQATREAVSEDGWLRTGDLLTPHADGSITFSDRSKDMLKVGGENVAASEIERVAIEVPGVAEVAVVAAPHPMLDEVPVAFVIPGDLRPGLAADVLAACRARLSDFKVPHEVRVVDQLPRSTLNKVAKAALRRQLAAERATAEQAAAE